MRADTLSLPEMTVDFSRADRAADLLCILIEHSAEMSDERFDRIMGFIEKSAVLSFRIPGSSDGRH